MRGEHLTVHILSASHKRDPGTRGSIILVQFMVPQNATTELSKVM